MDVKITLMLGEREVALTEKEAREMHAKLSALFGLPVFPTYGPNKPFVYPDRPVRVPTPFVMPSAPGDPFPPGTVTC